MGLQELKVIKLHLPIYVWMSGRAGWSIAIQWNDDPFYEDAAPCFEGAVMLLGMLSVV